jgi:hypothetical protein
MYENSHKREHLLKALSYFLGHLREDYRAFSLTNRVVANKRMIC